MAEPALEHVRALLSEEEYERLVEAAEWENQSVEAALREAVHQYADAHVPDADDPLFDVEPAEGDGEPIDVERLDDYLYGEMLDGES